MDFIELIAVANGTDCIDSLAGALSIGNDQATGLIVAASPHFIRALHERIGQPAGLAELRQLVASGGPQQYIEKPFLMQASIAQQEGQQLLSKLFPRRDVLPGLVSELRAESGLPHATIERALPRLASLFFGAICMKLSPDLVGRSAA